MDVGSISRFVLKHKVKVWVGGFWLAVVVAAIALMPLVFGNLSESFDMPGSESADMAAETTQLYGNEGTFPPLIIIVPRGSNRRVARISRRVAIPHLCPTMVEQPLATFTS
ncbi:hypothetical protein BH24CHL3_BH24CHL3_10530 [soil metagenome]